MESLPYSIEQYLSLLVPYFSEKTSLHEDTATIGTFLAAMMQVDAVALARLENDSYAVGCWLPTENPEKNKSISQRLDNIGFRLLTLMNSDGVAEGEALDRLMALEPGIHAIAHAFFYEKRLSGYLLICRRGESWSPQERRLLSTLRGLMGAAFAMHISIENESRSNFVFNTVMDGMKSSIYITEVETNRILFMNQAMKEDFGIEEPEGKICYEVLQKGFKHRCAFCPVERLLRDEKDAPVIQWDELNTVTGRSYRNYDSLIRWMDGSTVHLQQSIDVTELKTANTDELTQLLSRRPGKAALQDTFEHAREGGTFVTVCFYDINNLKEVNDRYGHAQGDRLITSVAWAVQDILRNGEYAFRMSGDEFVVVFLAKQGDSRMRLEKVQKKLQSLDDVFRAGFCYGLVEVAPDSCISAEEALLLADERMYEQKRQFHILRNEKRLLQATPLRSANVFRYDKDRLYDALVKSTEDYPFICNMKTGIFRYAPAMVEEFGLPGEVIENAAAVWGAKVHESDKAAFLEANQVITDGRAHSHDVKYRAQNRLGEWVWVRCRGHVELDENNEPSLFAGFISNLKAKGRIDRLTGLLNLLEFEESIENGLRLLSDSFFGVIVWGMDGFREINRKYGRAYGDEALRMTSQRLQSFLPPGTLLYRLEGDLFGALFPDAQMEKLNALCCDMSNRFRGLWEFEGNTYRCPLSGGAAMCPPDAGNGQALLEAALRRMDAAKE